MRLEPPEVPEQEAEVDSLMLGLFLDFLSRQAFKHKAGPSLYTEAMAAEDEELLAGVAMDSADEAAGP
jgi:antitoxin PrlF